MKDAFAIRRRLVAGNERQTAGRIRAHAAASGADLDFGGEWTADMELEVEVTVGMIQNWSVGLTVLSTPLMISMVAVVAVSDDTVICNPLAPWLRQIWLVV